MKTGKIIVVDDNKSILSSLLILLQNEFEILKTISSPNLLPSELRITNYDVVLLDMNFTKGTNSGNEGFFWLREIKKINPDIEVVMFTAYGEIELAVKSLKEGAFDFIVKPWDNDKLIATLHSALKLRLSRLEVTQLKAQEKNLKRAITKSDQILIGNSLAINKVLETIKKVAQTDANVLITGENGTGKELIARELHNLSLRKEEIFVLVDTASLPESLFESELFGHKKGAFTDAKEDRTGKFQLAHNGTLFLDEIGNLPVHLQTKLLTALQTRTIQPVGSDKTIPVNIRLVCATNANLEQLIEQGKFREDLHYRINTIHVHIPPLRERIEDIPLLAEHFTNFFAKKYNKAPRKLSQNAIDKLNKYKWPGNIRELQHCMERAIILSDQQTLTHEDFLLTQTRFEDTSIPETIEEMEKKMIITALKKHNGNISSVASHLGITRQTLYNKMERYGL